MRHRPVIQVNKTRRQFVIVSLIAHTRIKRNVPPPPRRRRQRQQRRIVAHPPLRLGVTHDDTLEQRVQQRERVRFLRRPRSTDPLRPEPIRLRRTNKTAKLRETPARRSSHPRRREEAYQRPSTGNQPPGTCTPPPAASWTSGPSGTRPKPPFATRREIKSFASFRFDRRRRRRRRRRPSLVASSWPPSAAAGTSRGRRRGPRVSPRGHAPKPAARPWFFYPCRRAPRWTARCPRRTLKTQLPIASTAAAGR